MKRTFAAGSLAGLAFAFAFAFAVLGCGRRDSTAETSAGASANKPATAKKPADADPPEAVAKQYLELGAAGDLSKVRELVEPKCASTKIGDVDAVKMLGARMTLTETTTTLESTANGSAKVKYTVKGSVDAKEGQTETDIFGKKATVKIGSMKMAGVTQSGTLELVKAGGRWVVTCR